MNLALWKESTDHGSMFLTPDFLGFSVFVFSMQKRSLLQKKLGLDFHQFQKGVLVLIVVIVIVVIVVVVVVILVVVHVLHVILTIRGRGKEGSRGVDKTQGFFEAEKDERTEQRYRRPKSRSRPIQAKSSDAAASISSSTTKSNTSSSTKPNASSWCAKGAISFAF